MSKAGLKESDSTNELQLEQLFSAVPDLFPEGIVSAFAQDLAEAISALGSCWASEMENFQRLLESWRIASEKLAENSKSTTADGSELIAKQLAEIESWKTINNDFLMEAIAKAPGLSPRHSQLLQFARRQFMSMVDSKNWPHSNTEILKKLAGTDGESLRKAVEYLQQDIAQGLGDFHIKRCAENAFQLGEEIAATEGEVVYQNDLIQLIHYRPAQAEVSSVPLLMIPPCINKYYILDLTKEFSVARWLVSQGIDLYMISWANPDTESDDLGLADYIERGVQAAKSFILSRSDTDQIHLAGYCIGGLFAALAAADTDKNTEIASLTLLNTLLDYRNPGELEVFLSERLVSALADRAKQEGYLSGNLLSWAFTLLKEKQLLWPYLVRRYMLGEELPKDPVMYWNQDVANLQPKMMSEYLKNLYLENRFWAAEKSVLDEKSLYLKDIRVPTYLLACTKDHIVDWKHSLGVSRKINADVRMVLVAGGHVMGILSALRKDKPGRYWVLDASDLDTSGRREFSLPEMDQGTSGSWWVDWNEWLKTQDASSKRLVDWNLESESSIEKAPGSYVTGLICE